MQEAVSARRDEAVPEAELTKAGAGSVGRIARLERADHDPVICLASHIRRLNAARKTTAYTTCNSGGLGRFGEGTNLYV